MTYEDVVRIGLAKPDVEDTMAWGTPALNRKKRFMIRLGNDGDHIVVRMDWEKP